VFEDFIEHVFHHCSPNTVLIMDNASFHHSERITQMCLEAGAELLYLPPYSPDLNPIEEFFAELKAHIKKQWHEYDNSLHHDFGGHTLSGASMWWGIGERVQVATFSMQV
jgi:transposase